MEKINSVKLILGSFVILLTSCQMKTSRTEPRVGVVTPAPIPSSSPRTNGNGSVSPTPVEPKDYSLEQKPETPAAANEPEATEGEIPATPLPPIQIPKLPKIGLIFGPGGAKTYAHIGVLQELQKAKIPIHAVAGIEFAAPMAALFAWKGLVNDVEWQMFKIKEDDVLKKGLISSSTKPGDVRQFQSFLKTVFHGLKAEELKKPFACPAHNLSKNQIFVMNRGSLEQLLPYCWPYPPFFQPFNNNVSGVRDLKIVSDHLRSQGANYVIFVNVLGGNLQKKPIPPVESVENLLWSELATSYARPQLGVDAMISLNLENFGILDLSQRREIMQKGAELANRQIQTLSQRLGL